MCHVKKLWKACGIRILCQCCISRTIQLSWIQCIFGFGWKPFCVEHVDLWDQFTAKRVRGQTRSFPAKPVAAAFTGPPWLLVSHPSHVESLWRDILCQCCISSTIQLSWIQCIFGFNWKPFCVEHADLWDQFTGVRGQTCSDIFLQNLLLQPSRALPGSLCRIPPMWKALAFDIVCQCCISSTIQLSWIQCIFGFDWRPFCVEHVDLWDQFTARRVRGQTCSDIFLQNLLLQPSRALPGCLCRIPPMWKACGIRYPLPVLHLQVGYSAFLVSIGSLSAWSMSICETSLQQKECVGKHVFWFSKNPVLLGCTWSCWVEFYQELGGLRIGECPDPDEGELPWYNLKRLSLSHSFLSFFSAVVFLSSGFPSQDDEQR